MNQDDHYRRQAAAAQRWADKAKTDHDRAAWLRVAQGWLSLIRKPRRTAAENFADAVAKQGTQQDESTKSH
jgi:hypothetical protein